MSRARLSLDSVPPPDATFAQSQLGHEYEAFLLGPDVDAVPFPHWTAHLREFFGWYGEEPDYMTAERNLHAVKDAISMGLAALGYETLALEVEAASSGDALNDLLIAQYTADGPFFQYVNGLLRRAHLGAEFHEHPITPWVLQFNTAIRQRPIFDGKSYRGVLLPEADIAQYRPGLMFEWAGFISASRRRDVATAFPGNVLFEITPWGGYSMYGKRNPLDIAASSVLPEEAEVIFPMACTFRVTDVEHLKHRTTVALQTVDQY